MQNQVKVLFVCHGNICRSTMAESVFAHLVRQKGLENEIFCNSAATSREEIGNPPHYGTVDKLRSVGVPLVPHRAVQMTRQDYEDYDLILGMDGWNIRNILRITGGDPAGKVRLLLDGTPRPRDIADPWYTGNFDETYRDVLEGCTALLKELTQK